MYEKTVKDFRSVVSEYRDVGEYIKDNEGKFNSVSLCEYLGLLIDDKGIEKTELIVSAGIEKSYLYQIFNGKRTPGRDKLIRIALAIGLNLDETQRLLIIAEKPILYPSRKRDAAIMFSLVKGHSLDICQIHLYDLELEILE